MNGNNGQVNTPLIDEEAQELGQELRSARIAAKMSIADIAGLLKLTEGVILGLEEGDFQRLQHKRSVYIEGYYASYARLLGISIANTRFNTYEDFEPPAEQESSVSTSNYQLSKESKLKLSDHSDAMITGLAVLLLLVVAGILWWVWPTAAESDTTPASAEETNTDVGSATQTAEQTSDVPFYLADDTGSSDDTTNELTEVTTEGEVVEANVVLSVPSSENDRLFNDDRVSTQEVDSDTEVAQAPGEFTPIVESGTVELTFSGLSWVEITDASGSSIFRELGRGGQSSTVEGVLPFTLRIGDALNVELLFENEVVDLAPHTSDRVANLQLPL